MQPLNSRVRALFHEQSIVENVQSLIADQSLPADVTVMVYPPGAEPEPSTAFVSLTLDKYMNGWRLALNIDDQSLFDAAANKRILSYLWTGVLVIAVLVIAAVLGGGAVRRQLRLAGLKNDLVASVSHELKTPLSSMRLLVDTLLNANRLDEHKVREYLHLIAKENTRLSRLIDNFLTFSRMQRSKPIFKKTETEAAKIAYTAVEAIGEKFDRERCRLEMQVASDLPNIMADLDALVTVVLNLLDNAYKYSEGDKHIVLRAYADKSYVYFEVQDKGVGLSRRAAKKVFKRFYQVDQRLSRAGGGCGLGLNIVQSIVTAHDGTISVDSEPGKGSTFTVRIPVAGSKSPRGIGGSG